ncbi:IS1-like element transposase [Candidatus Enterovibrio escicola]|uniref:IS1-like element transposase n=1 Tax=Candidatus Enterovibrio escicola TaxID=1927127 RepID=UPI003743848F
MKEQKVELAMNNSGIRDSSRVLHISINEVIQVLFHLGIPSQKPYVVGLKACPYL